LGGGVNDFGHAIWGKTLDLGAIEKGKLNNKDFYYEGKVEGPGSATNLKKR